MGIAVPAERQEEGARSLALFCLIFSKPSLAPCQDHSLGTDAVQMEWQVSFPRRKSDFYCSLCGSRNRRMLSIYSPLAPSQNAQTRPVPHLALQLNAAARVTEFIQAFPTELTASPAVTSCCYFLLYLVVTSDTWKEQGLRPNPKAGDGEGSVEISWETEAWGRHG